MAITISTIGFKGSLRNSFHDNWGSSVVDEEYDIN